MSQNSFETLAHPAWLPERVWEHLGRRSITLISNSTSDPVLKTVQRELLNATQRWGGTIREAGPADITFELGAEPFISSDKYTNLDPATAHESFEVTAPGNAAPTALHVRATSPIGLLYGLHHLVRFGDRAFSHPPKNVPGLLGIHAPQQPVRMLNHWDNMTDHPVMGTVERGYAGDSIFWHNATLRSDLSRAREYARLLGSLGINRISVNNVNVHEVEARLITDGVPHLRALAEIFRAHGVQIFASVSFAAPISVGGLETADPLDAQVRTWWAQIADNIWAHIPDFGGFVVKADSEGQPGPFAYGRDHADGANMLAAAIAPHGGELFWRAFVYEHRQDWRDRRTDRARAAYDHFAPLDGQFADNVIVQVKHGPLDFQPREPISPVLAAMPHTRLGIEMQVTQEYTGQQKHVCYLGPMWFEILNFQPWGDAVTLADIPAGHGPGGQMAGLIAVSNIGTDKFWTGHPLAQANLYAYGRLAWNTRADATELLREWITLTLGPGDFTDLEQMMAQSWRTYEDYTAPLGVGFMVQPGHHYGPAVEGYEYSPWGTYHFADRHGIGVDRTIATGTGYAGQYPAPWRDIYESEETCPDELLLFFHHVPWQHQLHSGKSVAQHIYDTHFRGVEAVADMIATWQNLTASVAAENAEFAQRVWDLLQEQLRSAIEWRDQINTYVWRMSGIADAQNRTIY